MSVSLGGLVSAGAAGVSSIEFQGLPCTQVTLASGERLVVAQHGAHVLSWVTADGVERLYLSPDAVMDGVAPIRGGVPLCFPQFNLRALGEPALPKHGFARTLRWNMQGVQLGQGRASLSFGLRANAMTRALWPHDFSATLDVRLQGGSLRLAFSVTNTGGLPWPFALALHTYLRVPDIGQTTLRGLQGKRYWDGVLNLAQPEIRALEAAPALTFAGETDRVYEELNGPLELHCPGAALRISQSANLPEVVVWNPAAGRCATLGDMPADGWKQMLCVEAACVNTPVVLAPGEAWSAWQELCVA